MYTVNLIAWVYFFFLNLFVVLERSEFRNNYLNRCLGFIKVYSVQVDQGSGASKLRTHSFPTVSEPLGRTRAPSVHWDTNYTTVPILRELVVQ